MPTWKAPVLTYEDAVQNILVFVENDEMGDELDPLFESKVMMINLKLNRIV